MEWNDSQVACPECGTELEPPGRGYRASGRPHVVCDTCSIVILEGPGHPRTSRGNKQSIKATRHACLTCDAKLWEVHHTLGDRLVAYEECPECGLVVLDSDELETFALFDE